MQITLQTIKNNVHTITVAADTATFDTLRAEAAKAFNYPENSGVTLIHKTKILTQTDQHLDTYPRLADGDRIIVMKKNTATAPKPPVVATPAPATTAPPADLPAVNISQVPEQPGAGCVAPSTASDAPPMATAAVPATGTAAVGTGNDLVMGAHADALIDNIVGLGFERELVRSAMRAAFNNPDRAVEYLMNGFTPPAEESALPPPVSQSAVPQAQVPGHLTDTPLGPLGGAPLRGVPSMPEQMRSLAGVDPAALPQIMQVIGEQNPDLLRLIEQNPETFAQIMADILSGEGGQGQGQGQAGPGRIQIELTEQEMEAVNRLCEMGFTRDQVLQAYLACDKDENLAANFLFDNGLGDDE